MSSDICYDMGGKSRYTLFVCNNKQSKVKFIIFYFMSGGIICITVSIILNKHISLTLYIVIQSKRLKYMIA